MPNSTRQTTLLSVHGFFTFPFACIPFLYFHFAEHGIGVGQYLQMVAWYYWAMVLLEIPTGVLADRCGRRLALALGSATLGVGFVVLYLGTTYPVFCTGQVILGLGHALLSGAPTALLYDSLRRSGQPELFLRAESRIHALRLFGTGGSFLVGGLVAYYAGLPATILLTAGLCLTGAVAALFLVEPPRGGGDARSGNRESLLRAAAMGLRRGPMLWMLVYFILLFGLLRFAFHTYQPFFEEAVFDPEQRELGFLQLGLLFAALNLVAAPASRIAPALSGRFRFRWVFFWLPTVLSVGFLAMTWLEGWWAVLLFFVHQVPFGMHWSLVQDFVNQRIEERARATTLSVLSFAGRISFAGWIPALGYYQEAEGTVATYGLLGWIGLGATAAWCLPGLGSRLLDREGKG